MRRNLLSQHIQGSETRLVLLKDTLDARASEILSLVNALLHVESTMTNGSSPSYQESHRIHRVSDLPSWIPPISSSDPPGPTNSQKRLVVLELSRVLIASPSLGPDLYRGLSSWLKTVPQDILIVLVLHSDALLHLSTMEIPGLDKTLERLFPTLWELSVEGDSMDREESMEDPTIKLYIRQKRPSGRVLRSVFYRSSSLSSSQNATDGGWVSEGTQIPRPTTVSKAPAPPATSKSTTTTTTPTKTKSSDPTQGLTFRLSLNETEAAARAALHLPHMALIPSSSVSEQQPTPSQEALIHYDHDDGDALDDEDPDEDLDI